MLTAPLLSCVAVCLTSVWYEGFSTSSRHLANTSVRLVDRGPVVRIDPVYKSHNVPVPFFTVHHSEQKWTPFWSEWWNRTGALRNLWGWPIHPWWQSPRVRNMPQLSIDLWKQISEKNETWKCNVSVDCLHLAWCQQRKQFFSLNAASLTQHGRLTGHAHIWIKLTESLPRCNKLNYIHGYSVCYGESMRWPAFKVGHFSDIS